jgi:soluble lytic murein transglycosylase
MRYFPLLCLLSACLALPANSQESATRQLSTQRSALDDLFLQARNANARNQADLLNKTIASANTAELAKFPLAMYLPYWQLRQRLQDKRPEVASSADGAVRDYLSQHTNTIAADLLRRDWLLNLGKRREWAAFEAQYPLWMLRDDSQVFCYEMEMRALRQDKLPEAIALLNSTREFSEGCASLVETLVNRGHIKPAEAANRVYAAIDASQLSIARRMAGVVPGLADAGAFDTAVSRPATAIEQRRSRELVLAAFARLARTSTEQAAALLGAREAMASEARTDASTTAERNQLRATAWAWVAAAAARKHAPEATQWARHSLGPANEKPLMISVSADTHHWLARAALRDADWKLLGQLIDRMPSYALDETWTYWRARVYAANNEVPAAQALWKSLAGNFSFYSQLAAEELGSPTELPAKAAAPSASDIAAWNNTPGFNRARRFYELGLRFEGNREWNWQLRGLTDRQLLAIAEWARKEGMLDRTINTSERTTAEFDYHQRFPTPLRDLMLTTSKERQLDAASVYGLIRQESRFIQDVRSSVGAQGLMQIMPATGRWIAQKMRVTDFQVHRLAEPELNVSFGTFYLKTVLDEFDGSLALAAAAYNAGPGRSRTWRASLKQTVDAAAFAETIPFAETRDYVKKVLSNATVYGQLLATQTGGTAPSLKKRLGSITPKQTTVPSDTP